MNIFEVSCTLLCKGNAEREASEVKFISESIFATFSAIKSHLLWKQDVFFAIFKPKNTFFKWLIMWKHSTCGSHTSGLESCITAFFCFVRFYNACIDDLTSKTRVSSDKRGRTESVKTLHFNKKPPHPGRVHFRFSCFDRLNTISFCAGNAGLWPQIIYTLREDTN